MAKIGSFSRPGYQPALGIRCPSIRKRSLTDVHAGKTRMSRLSNLLYTWQSLTGVNCRTPITLPCFDRKRPSNSRLSCFATAGRARDTSASAQQRRCRRRGVWAAPRTPSLTSPILLVAPTPHPGLSTCAMRVTVWQGCHLAHVRSDGGPSPVDREKAELRRVRFFSGAPLSGEVYGANALRIPRFKECQVRPKDVSEDVSENVRSDVTNAPRQARERK